LNIGSIEVLFLIAAAAILKIAAAVIISNKVTT
jgi:hypothetical protein